ncbi:hypothetical protein MMC14_000773 [Varicellaria rhodocarpa]|nr:hypothetical protein [Varicellaria rhodocarpa]
MAEIQNDIKRDNGNEPGSRTSSVPLLGEGPEERGKHSPSPPSELEENRVQESTGLPGEESKSSKRRLWGLMRKKEDAKPVKKPTSVQSAAITASTTSPAPSPAVYNSHSSSYNASTAPASPGRNFQSSSPHISSPASSQIFERNVQEEGLYISASPAIPAHITTENHIPPVLDASSVAITDDHLNPDNVEIVMHAAHQPAAVTVTGTGVSEAAGTSWQDDLVAHPDNDDAASNYGALDANDVRRLSFISFADVVHAEHVDHSLSRDSLHLSGPPSAMPLSPGARSPSPISSPISPTAMSQALGGSPQRSGPPSLKGLESSPSRIGRAPGSPRTTHSPPTGGELTIETMRQALRKTGSGDLSGARNQPIGTAGLDDGIVETVLK